MKMTQPLQPPLKTLALGMKFVRLFFIFGLVSSFCLSPGLAEDHSQKKSGFEFTQIEPGSVYDRMGLKKGDIVRSYNGKPLESGKEVEKMFEKLFKTPGVLKLEVERNGKTEIFTYTIK